MTKFSITINEENDEEIIKLVKTFLSTVCNSLPLVEVENQAKTAWDITKEQVKHFIYINHQLYTTRNIANAFNMSITDAKAMLNALCDEGKIQKNIFGDMDKLTTWSSPSFNH